MDFLGVGESDDWGDWSGSKDLHTQLFSPSKVAGKKTKASRKRRSQGEARQGPKLGATDSPPHKQTDSRHRPPASTPAEEEQKETPRKKQKKRKNRGDASAEGTEPVIKKSKVQVGRDALDGGQDPLSAKSQADGVDPESQDTGDPKKARKKRKRKPRNNKFKTADFGYAGLDSEQRLDSKGVSALPSGARTSDAVSPDSGEVTQDRMPPNPNPKRKRKQRKPRNNKSRDSESVKASSESQAGGLESEGQASIAGRGKKKGATKEMVNGKHRGSTAAQLTKAGEDTGRSAAGGEPKKTRTSSGDGKDPRKRRKKAGQSLLSKSSTDESMDSGIRASGKAQGRGEMGKGARRSKEKPLPAKAAVAVGKEAPEPVSGDGGQEATSEVEEEEPLPDVAARQALRSQMESRLTAAHFRFLNEQLYRSTGGEARRLVASDREAFDVYHRGFAQQVQRWPTNPVDHFIKHLKARPASLMVGDFGCGEARIAQSVNQKVHSFDLCAVNEHVTQCDLEKVPLKKSCLDVAVFCLSLMGTDWIAYIKEANRVLKKGGQLLIAEVASRFASVPDFLKILKLLGFKKVDKDFSNKMFLRFDFVKEATAHEVEMERGKVLRPCLYKRR